MNNFIAKNTVTMTSLFIVAILTRWYFIGAGAQPENNCLICVLSIVALYVVVITMLFYSLVRIIKWNSLLSYIAIIVALFVIYHVTEYALLRSFHILIANNDMVWEETVNAIGLRGIIERSNAIFILSFLVNESIRFFLKGRQEKNYFTLSLSGLISLCTFFLLIVNVFNLFKYI